MQSIPPLHHGRLPCYPQGGRVFGLHPAPITSAAGAFLATHAHADRQGRLFVGATPEGAFVFEGRARRGETFGLFAWPDASVAAWKPYRGSRRLSPVLFCAETADLGPLGHWSISWHDPTRGPTITPHTRHSSYLGARRIRGPGHPLFGTPGPSDAGRAGAVIRASLLAAWSAHIHHDTLVPVVDAQAVSVRPGWTLPAWSGGLTPPPQGLREARMRAAILPVLAHVVVGTGGCAPVCLTATSATRQPDGTPIAPQFSAIVASSWSSPHPHSARLIDVLNAAYARGALGGFFSWFQPTSGCAAEVVVSPEGLSRHQLLDALSRFSHRV